MKKLYFLFLLVMGFVAQAQIVNIPDANFKAKLLAANSSNQIASTETPILSIALSISSSTVSNYHVIDTNGDGEIQVSEAQMIKWLNVGNSNITDLTGIEYFSNLEFLNCSVNNLSNLNISNLQNLEFLICSSNQLQNLNFTNLSNLKDVSCNNNQLTSLDFSAAIGLEKILCDSNQLTSMNLTGLSSLKFLWGSSNQIQTLNLIGLNNLEYINIQNNQVQNLNLSVCPNLTKANCSTNPLISLNFSGLVNLRELSCATTQLTSLDFTGLNNLEYIFCGYNSQLTNLNVSNLTNLISLNCSNSQLTNLDVSSCTNLVSLTCNYNNLQNLLDLTNSQNLLNLFCDNNNLIELKLKNSNSHWNNLKFQNNLNIQFICADEEDITFVQNKINQYGLSATCHVNSYCSFTPGGFFYEISGQAKFDNNNNGCDVNDVDFSNLQFDINDGTSNGTFIANTSGNYYIPVSAGIHMVTPVLENPTYFNIAPTSVTVNFPTQASPFTQDFCVTKTGVHSDVEIAIIPTTPARPGFDATYELIFRNKGTEVENGSVTLTYDDSVLDYVQANPVYNSTGTNSYTWNYTNLQPFESRAITIEFNVNSPMETPAVNNGDILVYTATITTQNTDETPADNTVTLNQTVVGSYDPNDKTCLEGETINPSMIGEYVHYMIRFENTGTYPAENIVVRDDIDPTQFDIATLVPLSGSHEFYTRINGNKVEFIFENINLDFDDATNDGYVAFKIKTLSTLTVNSTISNTAKIYFDYNFPIVTNTATSTYQVLNAQNFEFDSAFTLFPNPAKEVLRLQAKNSFAIQSIEIYNVVGQLVLALPNAGTTLDVSSLESGSYFIKINTDNGSTSTKFIKQ